MSPDVLITGGDRIIPGSKLATEQVPTDVNLVAKAKRGDVAAFGDLIERHQRSVYNLVCGMVHNRDDADDVVQEVFVLAYRNIASFREECSFTTWLHRIAVNTTLKYIRKMKIRQAVSIDDPDTGLDKTLTTGDGEDTAQNKALGRVQNQEIRKAVDTLSEKHRIVVLMHYFGDYSCEEIAGILGCSVGTVWSRLHYACKKLRGQLDWLRS